MAVKFFEIPLRSGPQSLSVNIGGESYGLIFSYRDAPEAGWILTVERRNGVTVKGIAVVEGTDLVGAHPYAVPPNVGLAVQQDTEDCGCQITWEALGARARFFYAEDIYKRPLFQRDPPPLPVGDIPALPPLNPAARVSGNVLLSDQALAAYGPVQLFEDLVLADDAVLAGISQTYDISVSENAVMADSVAASAADVRATVRNLGRGVCMIIGNEFGYGITPVTANSGTENRNVVGETRSDMEVSVDNLIRDFPNLTAVVLVVSWFGLDLRAGSCEIRPCNDNPNKTTTPYSWTVAGQTRAQSRAVSLNSSGQPFFGGTPSDRSIIEAIRRLKARGIAVLFYPFMMMDIQPGNTLPNPYTGTNGQPQQPWRGQITTARHRSISSTTDRTGTVDTEVASFFGTVTAAQMGTYTINASTNDITISNYTGPAAWSFRRHILHYVRLCEAINAIDAGAVDGFLCATEMRELLCLRNASDAFPAVTALTQLIQDAKARLGSVQVGYAADWSEFTGYQPDGNSWYHHLDPVFMASDFCGMDNYMPTSDARTNTDAETGGSIYNLAYHRAQVRGGEYGDYFYGSQGDRQAVPPVRGQFPSGSGIDAWQPRRKRLLEWWSNQHFNLVNGVRSATPTSWTPQSRRIVFTEYGCGKVNLGSNQPNVFVDANSTQGGLPWFSNGERDDNIQTTYLAAMLLEWQPDSVKNPNSTVYSGPMVDLTWSCIWSWDSRPFPDFPLNTALWSDGPNFYRGHWIMGNLGTDSMPDLNERLLIVWAGQSNAEKHAYNEVQANGVAAAKKGFDYFVETIAPLLNTSPSNIVCVRVAVGASSILKRNEVLLQQNNPSAGGRGYWWDEDANTPGPLATAAKTLIDQQQGRLALIIWDQGEADWASFEPGYKVNETYRLAIAGGAVSVSMYNDAFQRLVAWFRAQYNAPDLPWLLSGIGMSHFPPQSYVDNATALPGGSTSQCPIYEYPQPGIEFAQAWQANNTPRVFRGPVRTKYRGTTSPSNTGVGPEWQYDPALSDDGIHLWGGDDGYGLQAQRLAALAAPIIRTVSPSVWAQNGYPDVTATRELIIIGNLNAGSLSTLFRWRIINWTITGTTLTMTCNRAHTLTNAMAGLPIELQRFGLPALRATLVSASGASITASVASGTPAGSASNPAGHYINCYSAARVMRDNILASRGWAAGSLSIVNCGWTPSVMDAEVNVLRNAAAGTPGSNAGTWWDHVNNQLTSHGLWTAEFMKRRASAVRGVIIEMGTTEYFFRNDYSLTTKWRPRMRSMLQAIRTVSGLTSVPFYMVRAGAVYWQGSAFNMTELQAEQTALVNDPTLAPISWGAFASNVNPGDPPNIDVSQTSTDGYSWTALGAWQMGQRLATNIGPLIQA